jgi:hypothetical protein
MIISIAAAALAAHLGAAPVPSGDTNGLVQQVRGGSCSHGYDIDIHGRCYPNGVIPPQYQAARRYGYGQGYGYQGGRYPGRCGHERCKPASVNRRA